MAERIRLIGDRESALGALLRRLVNVAKIGLPTMFRTDQRAFAYTCRRHGKGAPRLEGTSPRYGAIVLLGAHKLEDEAQRPIFGGELAADFCTRLIAALGEVRSLGDVALATWAAAELKHPDLGVALERLRTLAEESAPPTVETAWVLSALVAASHQFDTAADAQFIRHRLTCAFAPEAGVFSHLIDPNRGGCYRSHVSNFADQVYPIQALSRYHSAFGDTEALATADRCAGELCGLQGKAGQWWWHYDARTGAVIEGYPVYSVHQDAMGPMALLDLLDAGGTDHSDAIQKGLQWIDSAPEIASSLIVDDLALVWRKVARREPGKLVRSVRAVVSRINENLRWRWLDVVFPPGAIDYECRPYHLGWILYAWLDRH